MRKHLTSRKVPLHFFDVCPEAQLVWLGMAGALVNARGTILLVDPLITMDSSSGRPLCEGEYPLKVPLPLEARDIPRLDAVCYTHADGDHFGRLTARALASRLPCRFIAPAPVARGLRELGVEAGRIITARDLASVRIGEVEIVVTPALHDWQAENPWQRGDCCGYLFKTPDGTIWHPGDTRLIDELFGIKGVDVLFFDVAAVEAHLGPAGSARLAASSGARLLLAYHYGTFDLPGEAYASGDPAEGLPHVEGLAAELIQLDPGQPLRLPLRSR
jgi:L-ascorbate metabolism protein UlaG (beta-lactamase superfamily)